MIVILMGVSGCGKSTVGQLLRAKLGCEFLDADDYHPAANVEKMRNAIPLTDDDRWPWLDRLNERLRAADAHGESIILACSALKERYRTRLASGCGQLLWVHLRGEFELIRSRLEARKGHYMSAALLRSQFDALEQPQSALALDIGAAPEALAEQIAMALPQGSSPPGAAR